MRILIAEDEPDLNEIISKRLKNAGYSVDSCFNGDDALYYAQNCDYDAIIMDIMMPKVDGITALRKMRSCRISTPVILLTAKRDISDRVLGLDAGADDYLTKPFSFDELLARLRVVFRRKSDNLTNVFTVDDLIVDCDKKTVSRAGNPITLSNKEFAVLEYLIRNEGIVISKEKIEEHICNFDFEGDTSVVRVYIRYLRKKIDDNYENKLIHTIRNSGYVLKSGCSNGNEQN